jgi:CspA family cold shock protein
MVGVVKWFSANRGIGFIGQEKGADVFVHYSNIEAKGYRCLETGEVVRYEIVKSNPDRVEAIHVVKL